MAAPDGEVGIAADDQAFAGIVIGGDLGHVTLIEQGELQRPARGGKLTDGGRAQSGDPVEASRFDLGFEPGVGDHAVPGLDPGIADQHDAAEVEAGPQLGDLAGECHRVGRVAVEDLDGNGASVLVAEQSIDNLGAIWPVIAAVATLRKFTVLAFEVA